MKLDINLGLFNFFQNDSFPLRRTSAEEPFVWDPFGILSGSSWDCFVGCLGDPRATPLKILVSFLQLLERVLGFFCNSFWTIFEILLRSFRDSLRSVSLDAWRILRQQPKDNSFSTIIEIVKRRSRDPVGMLKRSLADPSGDACRILLEGFFSDPPDNPPRMLKDSL